MILGVGVSVVECSQIRLKVKIRYISTTHVILETKNLNASVGPSILLSMWMLLVFPNGPWHVSISKNESHSYHTRPTTARMYLPLHETRALPFLCFESHCSDTHQKRKLFKEVLAHINFASDAKVFFFFFFLKRSHNFWKRQSFNVVPSCQLQYTSQVLLRTHDVI